MRIDLTVIGPDGCGHDVAVRAAARARWADVRPTLSAALPAGHLPAQLWSGPAPVPDDATLGGRLLHCGAVLAPFPTDGRRAGGPVVQVVGGPSAGRWVAATDTVTLGRSAGCTLHLDDPDVSRRHAAVTLTGSGAAIADLGSTNGTTVDGRPVHGTPTPLPPGRVARLGNSFVGVRTERPVRCATRDGPGGAVLVNRAPRSVPAVPDTCVDLPVAPDAGRRARVQWATALVPALLGTGLAWAMHSVLFLLFAALSPVALLATGVSDRVGGRRGRRRARAEYRRAEAAARARLATAVAAETDLRRRAAPDPATVARIATTPERRLWERRRADTDLVRVRLGLGSVSSTLQAQRGTSAGRRRS